MLPNDTWFMYSDGFMNAAGKTPAQLDAEKKAAAEKAEKDTQETAGDASTSNLKKIEAACRGVKQTAFCKKFPGSIVCTGRINRCINQKMKLQGKALELDTNKASEKLNQQQIQKAINEGEDESSSSFAAGLGDDGDDDNTMLYVMGGVGVFAVFGVIGFLVYRSNQPQVA